MSCLIQNLQCFKMLIWEGKLNLFPVTGKVKGPWVERTDTGMSEVSANEITASMLFEKHVLQHQRPKSRLSTYISVEYIHIYLYSNLWRLLCLTKAKQTFLLCEHYICKCKFLRVSCQNLLSVIYFVKM